jgi:hypothetical protein
MIVILILSITAIVVIVFFSNNKEKKEYEKTKNRLYSIKEQVSEKTFNSLLNIKTSTELNLKIDVVLNEINRYKNLETKYGVENAEKLFYHKYFIGMTEEQLIDAKGNPSKIEEEILKTKTKKTYIYGAKSSGDYFVFEDGKAVKIVDR